MLKLYNTFSRQKEKFTPIKPPQVGLYTCGPTVYDFAHIGNLRTYIFEDLLRRVLTFNNYQVQHIMNITDIEDKIIRRAQQEKVEFTTITRRFTQVFLEDIDKLNILIAHELPSITTHINDIIKFIKVLINKGFAYQSDDGSVYFDISCSKDYGQLAGLDKQKLQMAASGRIRADEYERDEIGDFALWKSQSEAGEPAWDSPWGKGRPGWHIECSVLSMKYLGAHFDIHTGAVDLIFPHHTNEIAQSKAFSGKKFVNYWIEGEHLLVDKEKMAKSKGNFYTLRQVEERGFDPLAFRYLCLTTHYRSKLNFTWESLEGAQTALERLRNVAAARLAARQARVAATNSFQKKFLEAINDDLNLPQALAVTWDLTKSDSAPQEKLATLLDFDQVLGLKLSETVEKTSSVKIPKEVKKLVAEREKLREQGKFIEADRLRSQILDKSFSLEDTPKGPQISPISQGGVKAEIHR